MSNRYVWERSAITPHSGETYSGIANLGNPNVGTYKPLIVRFSNRIAPSGNSTEITLTGTINTERLYETYNVRISAGYYFYAYTTDGYRFPSAGVCYVASNALLSVRTGGNQFYLDGGSIRELDQYAKGTLVGTVSNASPSTYPLNNNRKGIARNYAILGRVANVA